MKAIFKNFVFFMVLIGVARLVNAVEINGFRSAHFGSNEAAVRAAIIKDLRVTNAAIVTKSDEQTGVSILQVEISAFEPMDLPAKITYTLGYKCKCLIQVAINWDASKISADPAKFLNRLGVLNGYLQRQGWDEKQVLTNKLLGEPKDGKDGVVLFFRGETKAQSAVALLGVGVKVTVSKEKTPDVNLDNIKSVVLVYDKSVQNPDVYTIEPGKF